MLQKAIHFGCCCSIVKRTEMKVSRVKIKVENNDGTWHEQTTLMPYEIAEKISCAIITWKEDWVATTKTVEDYQKSEKEFIDKDKS